MKSLNSICRARDEARYISHTWKKTPTTPDVPWEPVYKAPVETLDDIIGVCRPNPNTLSGMGIVYMTRRQYQEETLNTKQGV